MNQTVKKGEVIFFEGEPGNCAYIIEIGSVELSILVDGEQKKISQRKELISCTLDPRSRI